MQFLGTMFIRASLEATAAVFRLAVLDLAAPSARLVLLALNQLAEALKVATDPPLIKPDR